MAKKANRFVTIHTEGSMEVSQILADTVTGVCYLYHMCGSAAGLTPLLDRNGKPVIDESVIAPEKIGLFQNKE